MTSAKAWSGWYLSDSALITGDWLYLANSCAEECAIAAQHPMASNTNNGRLPRTAERVRTSTSLCEKTRARVRSHSLPKTSAVSRIVSAWMA
jgi:hypothetical protein